MVTVYALVDMSLYNRRKKKAYYADQYAFLQESLAAAREAAARGEADEAQILLLNRERAAKEAEQAAKQRKGMWGSTKEWLLSGMKKDEASEERVNEGGVLSVLGEEGLMKMREEPGEDKADDGGVLASVTTPTQESHHESHRNRGTILEAVEEKRREGEKALERKGVEGGLLDKLAQKAVEAGKADAGEAKRGWTSWLTSK